MPKPTLQNRTNFKQYLRHFKNKFPTPVQKVPHFYIKDMLSYESSGISTTTDVNVVIFDNRDTVAITSAVNNNELIYFPALPGDQVTLSIGTSSYSFNFIDEDGGITYNNTTYGLGDSISVGNYADGFKNLVVKGLGGALVQSEDGPSYEVGVSTTNVDEGNSVEFTINTTNVSAGTTLYYNAVGNVFSADFSDLSLTGSFNIVSTGATTGVATVVRTINNNFLDIDGKSFYLKITEESIAGTLVATSSTISINNINSEITVGVGTTSISEGDSISFIVNSAGINVGIKTLYFSTDGSVSAEDFSDNSLTGSFNLVSTGATTGIATITRIITNDLSSEGVESFNLLIREYLPSGTLVATSSTVYVSNAPIPTFDVGISTTTINEGDAVEFTVNTTGFSTSIPLYYSTGGSVTASDFTDSSLTGSFNLVSTGATTGVATITRTLAYDFESGAADTFNLSIRTGSTSGTVVATSSTITVNNLTPSFTITPSTTTINEGSSVDFTINTVNVGAGSTLYYSTDGNVSTADFSDGSLTGSFLIVGTGATTGIATVTRSLLNDLSFESSETFNFVVRTQSTSGTVVATSSTITVNNVVPTFTLTPSTDSTNEGSSVVFTVTTTGVPNGSILYWTTLATSGTVSASDFTDNALSGSFTVNNNTGSIARSITSDRTTETEEKFKLELRTTSTSGTIVATSDEVTINDTSLNVGNNSNGLTFGPVQVNRDGGNPALASDWYTICGIDNLPEGSSIALFIDTSGSMTQATIQASYNLLVEKLNAKNITITSVTNPDEDWITPFLVDLP